MANFTITIANTIRAYGPAPSMRWGVDSWGTLWGDGTQDTKVAVSKLISNSIGCDTSISLMAAFRKTLVNTLDFTEDLSSEKISVAGGYSYVYPGNSSNAENRVITTYSTAAAASVTYSSGSAGTTTWS